MKTTYHNLENELFTLINELRSDPNSFIQDLDKLRKLYDGKYFINQDLKAKMATHEGVTAVNEALESLYSQIPVPELARNRALDLSARMMQRFLGESGKVSSDIPEMKMGLRVKKFVKEGGLYAENISFGILNPINVINQFLISDGIPQRIHRNNIFNPKFTHIGISLGPHKDYGFVCVLQFFGPKSTDKESLIDLYDEAYHPENMPKVDRAVNVRITLKTQIVEDIRYNKFIYTFTLDNGQEVVKEVQTKESI